MQSFGGGVGGWREERAEEGMKGLGDCGGLMELFGVEVGHLGQAEECFGAPAADGDVVCGCFSHRSFGLGD